MTFLYVVLLGIIQGITEFLPVSSFGHLSILEKRFGIQKGPGVLLETMLHMGTLVAVILLFRKDIRQLLPEMKGIFGDAFSNLRVYVRSRRSGGKAHYRRVIHSGSRKLAAFLMISMIPTALLGYTARRLVVKAAVSPLMPGIGFLITGIFMLVVDLSKSGGSKTLVSAAGYDHAMWMGICQGLSVLPGVSRSGLTVSAALLCGYSRTFAVKVSYLMSIPAILGAMLVELGEFTSPVMTVGAGFLYLFGAAVAGVVGYFSIRFLLKVFCGIKLRWFAYYCFLAGALVLFGNYWG